jgi:bifunctional DNA-binding transcriptional regulator/antitoxin component of YhaV-PrlF toxin-antitoxin module
MGEKTALTKATSQSDSLRTTVPKGIVRQFNLQEKQMLDWEITAKDNKLIIIVTPL